MDRKLGFKYFNMETTRTIFSIPSQNDYQEILKLKTSVQVRKYLGGPASEADFKSSFKKIISVNKPEIYWVARDKNANNLVGLISITEHPNNEHLEVSYEINPNFWGKGYATEVVQRVIKYAFDELKLDKIIAETQKKNKASIKVLEKLGMTFESEVTRHNETQVIYGIQSKLRSRA